jgi:hypothetical protein
MRKLIMVLTLAAAWMASTGVSNALLTPQCSPNCPWVR